MLANAAGQFANTQQEKGRASRGSERGYDPAAWNVIAEQGWLSVLVPISHGGLGVGVGAAAVIARQFGRGALTEPFVAVGVMAALCLVGATPAPIWEQRLADLMAGKLVASLAWQAPAGDFNHSATGVEVTCVNGRLALNGACRLVAMPSSDAFIISARQDKEAVLYWIDRTSPGLSIVSEPCADGGALATLTFNDVTCLPDAGLAHASQAEALLMAALDTALVVMSAELLGIMDKCLDMTLEYLRTRRQFGAAIGSFQALQHRVVDIWIQRQLTEAALEAASATFDDPRMAAGARSAAASGIKARAAQAAAHLTREALQFHGAIGFADEYGLGLYLNRALVLSSWLGNAAQHRRRFARLTPFAIRTAAGMGDK